MLEVGAPQSQRWGVVRGFRVRVVTALTYLNVILLVVSAVTSARTFHYFEVSIAAIVLVPIVVYLALPIGTTRTSYTSALHLRS